MWAVCCAGLSALPDALRSCLENIPIRFDVDPGMCVYCGCSVEAYPEDAIHMDTEILDVVAYYREAIQPDIHELIDPALCKPLRNYQLTFPHQCALAGGSLTGHGQEPVP